MTKDEGRSKAHFRQAQMEELERVCGEEVPQCSPDVDGLLSAQWRKYRQHTLKYLGGLGSRPAAYPQMVWDRSGFVFVLLAKCFCNVSLIKGTVCSQVSVGIKGPPHRR